MCCCDVLRARLPQSVVVNKNKEIRGEIIGPMTIYDDEISIEFSVVWAPVQNCLSIISEKCICWLLMDMFPVPSRVSPMNLAVWDI